MKTKSLYLYLVALACLLPFCSCSDDDDVVATPLTAPTLTAEEVGIHTLHFSWPAVPGATQYAYELRATDADAVQEGDVTNQTAVYFDNLSDDTSYTLTVWAFAEYGGDKSTSQVSTLTASTLPRIRLAAPQPVVTEVGATISVTWEAVPHATRYSFECRDADSQVVQSGRTVSPKLFFTLEAGTYTVVLWADTDDWDYVRSEDVTVSFTVEKKLVYVAQGTFSFGGSSWQATISAYEGGAYSIASWYGTEGYDFNFQVGEDDEVTMPGYFNDGFYIYVPMSAEYTAYLYDDHNTIERNGTTVTLRFLEYYVDDWCSFTWEDPTAAAISVDDIVGTYTEASSGYDYYIWDWGNSDKSFSYEDNTVTISKVDNTTVAVKGFYWIDETLTATLDPASRTLTFAAGQTFASWYSFAAETPDENTPVVAQINEDGTISINGWSAWYSGYAYVLSTTTTLTPVQ